MMFFWSSYPFIRYTAFLIAGIILGRIYPDTAGLVGTAGVAMLISLFILYLNKSKFLISYNWSYGLLISTLCLAVGYYTVGDFMGDSLQVRSEVEAFSGVVVSSPQQGSNFQRMEVDVTGSRSASWGSECQKVLLYVRDSVERFHYGDELLVKGKLQLIQAPLNPGVFDFKSFMGNKKVYSQAFVALDDVQVINNNMGSPVIAASLKARAFAEQLLAKYITAQEPLSIAKALVLGVKTDLESDTRSLYAQTGVMHILAVSGLHVGILYILILMMLGQKVNLITKPVLVAVVAIPILWAYAFITGLSPSVLRAVTMFSLIAVAQAVNRKSNVINTVAISGFLLLLINPLMLFTVGFQLSYLAVFGIIIIYPKIINLYTPSHNITYKIWQLIAISLAAQLATFPLSLYYFHRFPTYFLVGNLVAVPAAMVIVWLGLALILGGSLSGAIGLVVGKVLTFVIQGLNWVLVQLLHLPVSSADALFLSGSEVILIYILLALFLLWWIYKKQYWLMLGGFTGVILLVTTSFNIMQQNSEKSITFYSLSGHWAIDLVSNGEATLLCDDHFMDSPNKFNYQIDPNRLQKGLSDAVNPEISEVTTALGKVISFQGLQVLVAEKLIDETQIPAFIDYAIIGERRYGRGSRQMVFNEVICFESSGAVVHNLQKQGALVIDL